MNLISAEVEKINANSKEELKAALVKGLASRVEEQSNIKSLTQ